MLITPIVPANNVDMTKSELSTLVSQPPRPVHTEQVDFLGYLVSDFPKGKTCLFPMVFDAKANRNYFEISDMHLSSVGIAGRMFGGSRNLTDFESSVLQKTLRKVAIDKPTLPGRK